MIFTKIYIDNLYCFKEATLDLTIPRQIKNSTIQDEYLLNRPKFRYKKVCILTGGNSSGKTSLGRIMLFIQGFIRYKNFDVSSIKSAICNKDQPAEIDIEFVTVKDSLAHKIYLEFNNEDGIKNFKFVSIPIYKNDSAISSQKKLINAFNGKLSDHDRIIDGFGNKKTSALEHFNQIKVDSMGWYYLFSENSDSFSSLEVDKEYLSAMLMGNILKTFDPSIKSVTESRSINEENENELNGFSIRFGNNDNVLLDLKGDVTNRSRLSKGTYDAIQVSSFIARILFDKKLQLHFKNGSGSVYFLDERMAYVHSELEQSIINLIITKLPQYAQFFYTTHNMDILELNLPIHSFCFLRKNDSFSEFVDPSKLFKKNDRNFSNYVRNNFFLTQPSPQGIDNLLEDE